MERFAQRFWLGHFNPEGPVGNVAIADVFAWRSAVHNLNMVSSASVPMATAIPRSQRRLIRFHPSPVITPIVLLFTAPAGPNVQP